MKMTTIGFDRAKTVFHVFAVNHTGRLVIKKPLKRQDGLSFLPSCPLV